MGRSRLSACHHHTDCQRRPARRHHRPKAVASGRNRPVHNGIAPLRRGTHALAAHRRTRAAGPRSGHHDGPRHGLCRRNCSEGQDRQRHGPARGHLRDRHCIGPIARRRSDRRSRLAGNLPRQRSAWRSGFCNRRSLSAHRQPGAEVGARPASTSWVHCCWP